MQDDNNTTNYPLQPQPDFAPVKKPSRIKLWLQNLTPKKKLWLGLSLLIAVIAGALIIYFSLATNKKFYFEPESGTWQPGGTYTIKVFVQDTDNQFINGLKMEIKYAGNFFIGGDENTQITASFPTSFKQYAADGTPDNIEIEPIVGRGIDTIMFETKNNLLTINANFQPLHVLDINIIVPNSVLPGAEFKLEFEDKQNFLYSGGIGNFVDSESGLDTNMASFITVSADINKAILYFNPGAGSLILGRDELVNLMLQTNEDVVAVGATIKYEPDKIKLEIFDSPNFPVKGDENHDASQGIFTIVRGAHGDGVADLKGQSGNKKILGLKITPLVKTDSTSIAFNNDPLVIDDPLVIIDDGNGTKKTTVGITGTFSIINEIEAPNILTISEQDYICNTRYDDNSVPVEYDLNVSWKTNLSADSKLMLDSGKSKEDVNLSNNHSLTIDNAGELGNYFIESKITGANPQTARSPVVSTETHGFSCVFEKANLQIRELTVAPSTDNTADVFFMTTGGINQGKASVKADDLKLFLSEPDLANNKDVAITVKPSSGTENTNVHRFNISVLSANTEYILKVSATDGSETPEKTIKFVTPKYEQPGYNTVLKVDRDRICDNWLYCRSAAQIVNSKNKTETLCFDIGLCDRLDSNGNCISPVDLGKLGVTGSNQTFVSPYFSKNTEDENKYKNLSGFSKVGMTWAISTEASFEGYRHYAAMNQVGENINLLNGNFELNDLWPWENNALGIISVVSDDYHPSNHILKIATDIKEADKNTNSGLYSGAKISLGKLQGSQEYVLSFDVKSSTNNKDIKVQINNKDVLSLTAGRGFQNITHLISGQIPSEEIKLQFNQLRTSVNTGENAEEFKQPFYIDNVSLQPVLHIQNKQGAIEQDLYADRSCRLYASSDAPDCNYTSSQDGKQYSGWKGYCVEQDPRDSNMCLNWYPVDILVGETDIFSSDPLAGYSDRKPLYYCLESNGGYPYYEKRIVPYVGSIANWQYPFDVSYLKIFKDEIIEIKINGVKLYVNSTRVDSSRCNIIAVHEEAVGGGSIDDDQSQPQSNSTPSGALIFNQDNKGFWESPFNAQYKKEDDTADVNPGIAVRCSGKGADDDVMNMTARLIFNADNILEKIIVKGQDPEGRDGWAEFEGIYLTYLGERCNVIAQVVDPFGKNYAFNSNVKNNGWSNGNNLGFSYNQDYKPYGAVVPPSNLELGISQNDPTTWTEPLYVMPANNSTGMTAPYQVRAGSPYSVVDDNSFGKCSNKNSQYCKENSDCEFTIPSGTCFDIGICKISDIDCFEGTGECENLYGDSAYCYGAERDPDGNPQTFDDISGSCVIDVSDLVCSGSAGNCPSIESKGVCEFNKENIGKTQCVAGQAENLGKECKNNSDCGYADGLCMGIKLSAEQQNQLVGGWEKGQTNLSGLFAKSLGVWKWKKDEGDGKYKYIRQLEYDEQIKDSNNPQYNWDNRKDLGEAPVVKNISVNGYSFSNYHNREVLVFNGIASIVLRFTADINANQLPMTEYRVDWGDGKQSAMTNLYIAPHSDVKNPHIMLHSYVCEDKGSLPDCDVVSNRLTNCWEVDPENQENGKCLFTPKIQVKDNWEMCNGGIVGEVCPSDVNKWAAFGSQTPTATAKGGKIIVEP